MGRAFRPNELTLAQPAGIPRLGSRRASPEVRGLVRYMDDVAIYGERAGLVAVRAELRRQFDALDPEGTKQWIALTDGAEALQPGEDRQRARRAAVRRCRETLGGPWRALTRGK